MSVGQLLSANFTIYNDNDDVQLMKKHIGLIDVIAQIDNEDIQYCIVSTDDGFDVNILLFKPGKLFLSVAYNGNIISKFPVEIDIIQTVMMK